MDCCATQGTNRFFSRWSKTYAKRFRKKGLAKEQKQLVEGITKHPIASRTILDIGSGIGSILFTLLQQGAASAVAVDIAEGMVQKSKEIARELELTSRVRYYVGDFVGMNGEISASDITILDKVVCCYEDVDALIKKSVAKTKEVYALSFPRNSLPVASIFKAQIFLSKLFRWSFHPHWHDWEAICRKIQSYGFEEIYRNKTVFWSIRVYRKR